MTVLLKTKRSSPVFPFMLPESFVFFLCHVEVVELSDKVWKFETFCPEALYISLLVKRYEIAVLWKLIARAYLVQSDALWPLYLMLSKIFVLVAQIF